MHSLLLNPSPAWHGQQGCAHWHGRRRPAPGPGPSVLTLALPSHLLPSPSLLSPPAGRPQALGAPVDFEGGGEHLTPLVAAAQAGSLPALKLLLEAGARPGLATRTGATPLRAAALAGDVAAIEALAAAGAPLDQARGRAGRRETPGRASVPNWFRPLTRAVGQSGPLSILRSPVLSRCLRPPTSHSGRRRREEQRSPQLQAEGRPAAWCAITSLRL